MATHPAMELTDRAWLVIQKAREQAWSLGDDYVGTDHILLAMLADADGAAAYALEDLGVDYERVFERLISTA